VEETAGVLKFSAEKVRRDWNLARTWLYREMSEGPASKKKPGATDV
jgi:hypothetical protein